MKQEIIITGSQHKRTWELDFSFVPANEQEFKDFIENATWDIMKGCGFCIWEKINVVIEENASKKLHNQVELPIYDLSLNETGETITFDLGSINKPIEKISEDCYIILIPGEWYNSIPEGYTIYSISASKEQFKSGETDDDIRFGCLAYGILKPLSFIDK